MALTPEEDEEQARIREMAQRERRRDEYDASEEEEYYSRLADEEAAEEEEAEQRSAAIEQMVDWFHEQFEDPANDTPWDGEDKQYVFMWGGPFEAGDVVGSQFSSEFKSDWVEAAVEQIEKDGIYEWAPTSSGDFYDHPDPEPENQDEVPSGDQATLVATILSRLDDIEARLDMLPASPLAIGHNQPPDDIGLPPYNDETREELRLAIATVRVELSEPAPDPEKLVPAESKFRAVGTAFLGWAAKKADVAVDEVIKNSIKLAIWTEVAHLLLDTAADLLKMLRPFLHL
jgi:hypothetical protein